MTQLKNTLIFDPQGDDTRNPLWGGRPTGLIKLIGPNQRLWAKTTYDRMVQNFWVPDRVSLAADVHHYMEMTSDQRHAYNGVLSYLTFLDSVQTINIPNFSAAMSAPEVRQTLAAHQHQEAIHNDSYRYIIETAIPLRDQDRVYEFWRTDPVLRERCSYIASLYQSYLDERTNLSYLRGLIANYLLEALYFYSGFTFFGVLAYSQIMPGTGDMFSLIRRDEQIHCAIFAQILREAFVHFSDEYSEDMVYDMFDEAVRQEKLWAEHIIGDRILGISSGDLEQYIQFWANRRLEEIGLNAIYSAKMNPFLHIDHFYDQSLGDSASNFFERTTTSYVIKADGLGEIHDCLL